jgi:hypothetical protein
MVPFVACYTFYLFYDEAGVVGGRGGMITSDKPFYRARERLHTH